MKKLFSGLLLAGVLLHSGCAIPGVMSSATAGKVGMAAGSVAAGSLASRVIDLNDGKVAGMIPLATLEPVLRKAGVPEFLIAQLRTHQKMAQLAGILSSNDVLVLTYRVRTTGQVIDPSDIELAFTVNGVRGQQFAPVPDIGIPVRVTAPTAPAVPPATAPLPDTVPAAPGPAVPGAGGLFAPANTGVEQ